MKRNKYVAQQLKIFIKGDNSCLTNFVRVIAFDSWNFYAPGLKGPPGASSNRIVRPFVRNPVPLTNKVQYLKFG